jgi:hypothetical protein
MGSAPCIDCDALGHILLANEKVLNLFDVSDTGFKIVKARRRGTAHEQHNRYKRHELHGATHSIM